MRVVRRNNDPVQLRNSTKEPLVQFGMQSANIYNIMYRELVKQTGTSRAA